MFGKTHQPWKIVLKYLLLALILGSASGYADYRFERPTVEGQELLYFPNGTLLKEACLGYEQAVAALTWLRALQYYGGHVRGDYEFRHMHHLCDVITDLDPRFEEPYVFGSYVMVTDLEEPDKAIALMRKGRENNPDSWRMQFESGIIGYLASGDRAQSADFFIRAAEYPDAPEYTLRFAAFMTEERGDLQQAVVMWKVVAESSKIKETRQRAQEKVEELEAAIKAQAEANHDL